MHSGSDDSELDENDEKVTVELEDDYDGPNEDVLACETDRLSHGIHGGHMEACSARNEQKLCGIQGG